MAKRLKDMTCPQCKKPFVLSWEDYDYDPNTKKYQTVACTLILRGCDSGGIYNVEIKCPHCDYEEEL